MNLVGAALYDYSKDGRKNRIDDLTNGISYLNNYSDSTSQLQIKFYNDDANKNKLKEDMLNNKFFSKLENYFINKRKEVPTDKIKKH